MRHILHRAGLLAACLGLAVTGASAKPIPDGGVLVADVTAALATAGYTFEILTDDQGDPMVDSMVGDKAFRIFFAGCDAQKRCATLELSTGYDLEGGLSLETVNEWNHTKRFGKVSLDAEMDPFVRLDIDAEKGFSDEALVNYLATWEAVLLAFEEFIEL